MRETIPAITADTYVTVQNDRLDKICRRRYGSEGQDVVLFVLAQNPGLEREGILLTPGITVRLPDAPETVTTPITTGQIFLWT